MSDQVPAVDSTPPAAVAPVVTEVVPPASDLSAKLAEAEAQLQRLAVERDNYKQGLLNAKDRLKQAGVEDRVEETDVVAVVDQRLQEVIAPLTAQLAALSKERDELARAVAARASTTQGGATSGQQIVEPELPKLTPAEEALLARRGLSAKDVLK